MKFGLFHQNSFLNFVHFLEELEIIIFTIVSVSHYTFGKNPGYYAALHSLINEQKIQYNNISPYS